jgi:C1A family cysteine protease
MGQINKRRYGWKPDLPDHRDFYYKKLARKEKLQVLPKKVDLLETHLSPPLFDQKSTSSCTAQGISAGLYFVRAKQKLPLFIPSRLFIYWNERVMEGSTMIDDGAIIRDGIKSLAKIGYCNEDLWKFEEELLLKKPSKECFDQAKKYKSLNYYRINNSKIRDLKNCLAQGFPIVFGATLYASFDEAEKNGGAVPMPKKDEDILGGHCMLLIGYDDDKQQFKIRNSWGESYGDKGYNYFPYDYLTDTNLADDFWTIRSVVDN